VSPHEFLQAVMKASKKRFRIGQQSDPVEFMSWLLNTLHMDLRTSKDASSIIHKCFQVCVRPLKCQHNAVWYNFLQKSCISCNLLTITGWVGGCERVSRQWKQRNLQDAVSDAWARFATASSFQRCHGEKHYSAGIWLFQILKVLLLCAIKKMHFRKMITWSARKLMILNIQLHK